MPDDLPLVVSSYFTDHDSAHRMGARCRIAGNPSDLDPTEREIPGDRMPRAAATTSSFLVGISTLLVEAEVFELFRDILA